jgi:protein-tyrosine phosphatase
MTRPSANTCCPGNSASCPQLEDGTKCESDWPATAPAQQQLECDSHSLILVQKNDTIRTKGLARHNFGPASSRDCIVFTSERPGNPACKMNPISVEATQPWIEFMLRKGITNVLVLLDPWELETYTEMSLENIYKQAEIKCFFEPMKEEGACDRIFQILYDAEQRGEKIVAHCTGGCGRSGRIAAGWIIYRYGVSVEEATDEVVRCAIRNSVCRKGNCYMLAEWLNAPHLNCC